MKKLDSTWLYTTPIAHRGLYDNGYFPENTKPAFEEAIRCGYAIELDVQMTIDNVLVVIHDDNMTRILGVDKDVRDMTYEELTKYTPYNKGYPVLTFNEFLNLINGRTPILIEVKTQKRKGIEKLLVEELKNYKGKFAVQSFNPNIVKRVNMLAPHFVIGVLVTREINPKVPAFVQKLIHAFVFKLYIPFNFLSLRVEDLEISYKRAKKYNVITWTIVDEKQLKIADIYAKNIIFERTVPSLGRFGEKKF
jgi:glycerophosphoryl diester phosphodiesterase